LHRAGAAGAATISAAAAKCRAAHARNDIDMDAPLRRTALWATAIQGLFALTWALYVAFLPGLLARAGLEAGLAIFFVLLDQAVFAVADWASGVYADRLARMLNRIGPALTACAMFSSCALAALPWIAGLGVPALLVAVTVAWTASSSALRAPVFTLLGRVGGAARPAGAVSLALLGIGVAGAIAPMFTRALAQYDAGAALGVCAASLAVAALFASRLESAGAGASATAPQSTGTSTPAPGAAAAAGSTAPAATAVAETATGASTTGVTSTGAPAFFIAALVAVGALGVQVHTVLLGSRAAKAGLTWAAWWAPAFWSGFALGLVVAAFVGRVKETAPPLRIGGAGLVLGALAIVVAQAASDAALFLVTQLVAGAAWALFTAVAVRAAMVHGAGRGIGAPLGLIFSALAFAALARLGLVIAGWQGGAWLAWVPAIAFVVCGSVLLVFALGGARSPEPVAAAR
jgi:hypothetical protein